MNVVTALFKVYCTDANDATCVLLNYVSNIISVSAVGIGLPIEIRKSFAPKGNLATVVHGQS